MNPISTIRLRLWLPISILIAYTLLLGFFSYVQYRDFEHRLEYQTATDLHARITRCNTRIERFIQMDLKNMIRAEIVDLSITEGMENIALVDDQGQILYGSQIEWNNQDVHKYLPGFDYKLFHSVRNTKKPLFFFKGKNRFLGYEPIVLATLEGQIKPTRVGVLYVDYDISRIKSIEVQSLLKNSLLVWSLGLLLILLMQVALRHWLLRPLRHLETIVHRFSLHNYDSRTQLTGRGELAKLGSTLNVMADELVKAKAKAEESDRLKSAFLANMSHEIRTPMNGILGFSELLKEPDLPDTERGKYIGIINRNSQQLLTIINDIVDISKIEAGQESLHPEEFNLKELLDDLIEFLRPQADRKHIALRHIPCKAGANPIIVEDKTKLRQVLLNLVANAIKFTSAGSVEVECVPDNRQLVFKVRDTGIGIDPKHQEIIFDRFRQAETSTARQFGGTGLGLSISKSYIEMMGGTIGVESVPGEGSTFTFCIPYHPAQPVIEPVEAPANRETEKQPDLSYKIILLVEDDEDSAMLIRQVLMHNGAKLKHVKDGREAVELCKTDHGIRLVLMDMALPKMTGFEATKIIKSFRNDLPVIATTAYALSGDRERCIEAGCDDYLPKPIRKEVLIEMVDRYVGRGT